MSIRFVPRVALAALLAMPAWAQPPSQGGTPAWRSAFEGYQPFTPAPAASWREANDTVGRIGGWRAYARESRATPPRASAPAAAPRDEAQPPHRGLHD